MGFIAVGRWLNCITIFLLTISGEARAACQAYLYTSTHSITTPMDAGVFGSTGVPLQGIDTYRDLEDAIYTELSGGDACIRLLTAQGQVGCAASSAASVKGVLVRGDATTSPSTLPDDAVVVLAAPDAGPFLQKCISTPDLCSSVQAALIEYSEAWPGWNPSPAAPQSDYALYPDKSYVWNPSGVGIALGDVPFPVFQLDNDTTLSAQDRVKYNERQGMEGSLNVASMEVTMEAKGNTTACVAEGLCLPLGGHSVWAAVPPFNQSSSDGGMDNYELPLIMVLAGIDSGSFFHELTQASNYPLSGLVAMLTAAEILGNASSSTAAAAAGGGGGGGVSEGYTQYKRRIVFTALAGESWGYMGSKRLLWTLYNNSADSGVAGLNLNNIQAVLEVGAIGQSLVQQEQQQQQEPLLQLYYHRDKAQAESTTAELAQALQAAAAASTAGTAALSFGIKIKRAGDATPGLPPSSASSFLRMKPDLPALVLTEYNEAFGDGRYQSQFDTVDSVNASAIAGSAIILAHALHALALTPPPTSPSPTPATPAALPIDLPSVQATVQELMGCLMRSDPGLTCPLAQSMMTSYTAAVPHYIGILRTITEDAQNPDPNIKKDVERFIWNFFAFAAAGVRPAAALARESSLQRCRFSNVTECGGYDGTGVCLPATVRYIPSYSTSLLCDGCNGTATFYQYRWKVTEAASQWEVDHQWPSDPMWTESNWPSSTPHLEFFLKESSTAVTGVLIAGVCVTVASIVAVVGVQYKYGKRLKQM